MNAAELIARDPAKAAVMGALGSANADFGTDWDFGDDFEFGDDDDDAEMSGPYAGVYGDGFEFGVGKARAKRMSGKLGNVQKMLAFERVSRRRSLIDPNANSSLKVEKYSFNLEQAITLGTPLAAFATLTGQPDVTIRPQRLSCNVPAPMFAFFTTIRMANVNVSIGVGRMDAWDFNANGVGQTMDMPTLSPAHRATITGNYTGFVPPGYTAIASFLTVSFKGPSTLVAM